MGELEIITYSDHYKHTLFPSFVGDKYYKKYTTASLLYKFLRYSGIYLSDFYLLVDDSGVVGCFLLRFRFCFTLFSFQWFIYGVTIKPAERGKGFGSKLIENALSMCREKRINKIFLFVDRNNSTAISLYEKHGFSIVTSRLMKSCRGKDRTEVLMGRVL